MRDLSSADLSRLVEQCWEEGRNIDLQGVGYGRIHWGNFKDVNRTPTPYYQFLAGVVSHLDVTRILEIGTHSGGSAIAMQRGMHGRDGVVVTVDITRESNRYLKGYRNIIKIRGDSTKEKTIAKIKSALDGQRIDLLFIDGDHKFYPALFNYAVLNTLFRPTVICLDDITLNEEMRQLWEVLKQSLPVGRAVNAAEVVPEIRPGRPGFGYILANT